MALTTEDKQILKLYLAYYKKSPAADLDLGVSLFEMPEEQVRAILKGFAFKYKIEAETTRDHHQGRVVSLQTLIDELAAYSADYEPPEEG